jgi:hypothetical protein
VFNIEVSRWAAKATVRKASGLNSIATGSTFLINDVGGLSFCMGNVNSKMYPIQKRSAGDFIEDPNFAADYSLYGAEMVHDFGSNTYGSGLSPVPLFTDAYMDVDNDGIAISARNNKYTVENTSQSPYLRGLMPYISVRAKFIPNTLVSSYDPSTGLATSTPNSAQVNSVTVYITADGVYTYFPNATLANTWSAHPANAGYTHLGRYWNAYCYYLIYLDPKTSYPLAPYASIRNLFYDTRITQIDKLGYPTPYPEDSYPAMPPETPARISADMDVKNWTPVLQP